MRTDQLKHPILIYSFGFLFLLSPFINFVISLWVQGVSGWARPQIWGVFLHQITPLSWSIMALHFLTGIALLVPRKASWFFAESVLILTVGYNLFVSSQTRSIIPYADAFLIFCSVGFIIVLYFFRYPYIDRRGYLFIANRYSIQQPIRISEYPAGAEIINLSTSGILFAWKTEIPEELPHVGELIEIKLNEKLTVTGVVVGHSPSGCRVKFKGLTLAVRNSLKAYIAQHRI